MYQLPIQSERHALILSAALHEYRVSLRKELTFWQSADTSEDIRSQMISGSSEDIQSVTDLLGDIAEVRQ